MEQKLGGNLQIKSVAIEAPEGCNVIVGQDHVIKSVEDLFEALVNSVPGIKFGLAFCEASGPCLVRHEGTDESLRKLASQKALEIGAGHALLIYLKGSYPFNVLNAPTQRSRALQHFLRHGKPRGSHFGGIRAGQRNPRSN